MTESGTDGTAFHWSVPECPFSIESSARVLDDIRLAVTDAFFSLPRGGAEIGGILLGTFHSGRLVISDYAALECEHAYGPSFVLSPPDEARLIELLSAHARAAGGLRPVGWYHSHTRSEIFLSDADLEIHNRFFPEAWQVALVIKPHTFQPARIGYFFREADGSVHTTASYREEVLEALPMRQMPSGPPAAAPSNEPQPRNLRPNPASSPVLEIVPEPAAAPMPPLPVSFSEPALQFPSVSTPAVGPPHLVPTPAQAAGHEADPTRAAAEGSPAPKFVQSASSTRRWLGIGIGAVALLGILGAGFKTRQLWLPRALAAIGPAPAASSPPPLPSLGLNTIDREGQLQITWDRSAAPVRDAAYAVLEIQCGPVPVAIQLDTAHLQTGSFTYARTAEKVDVKLIVHPKTGPDIREATSFLGKLPERKAAEDPELVKQRDEMAKQAVKMKAELTTQAAKTKKLERDVESMREEMRLQQQRRMTNQLPDK